MGQMKYYFLQIRSIRYDEKTMGRGKRSSKVLQKKAKHYLKKVQETSLQKQQIKTFN